MSACNEISGDIAGSRESFLIAFLLIRLKSVLKHYYTLQCLQKQCTYACIADIRRAPLLCLNANNKLLRRTNGPFSFYLLSFDSIWLSGQLLCVSTCCQKWRTSNYHDHCFEQKNNFTLMTPLVIQPYLHFMSQSFLLSQRFNTSLTY